MKQTKPSTFKRVCAYLIDLIIIMLFIDLLSSLLLDLTKYNEKNTELLNITKQYSSGEITGNDYIEAYDKLHYEISKAGIKVNVVSCIAITIYFVVLCYFCKGLTFGKYIMKMQIVSNNGKKLTMLNYFLRSLVANMLLSNAITVLLIKTLSEGQFIKLDTYIQNGISLAMIISFLLIMYRNDGRGLEDFMGNTKVIDLKKMQKDAIVDSEEVKDAVVIEKTNKKKSKDVK